MLCLPRAVRCLVRVWAIRWNQNLDCFVWYAVWVVDLMKNLSGTCVVLFMPLSGMPGKMPADRHTTVNRASRRQGDKIYALAHPAGLVGIDRLGRFS